MFTLGLTSLECRRIAHCILFAHRAFNGLKCEHCAEMIKYFKMNVYLLYVQSQSTSTNNATHSLLYLLKLVEQLGTLYTVLHPNSQLQLIVTYIA